MYTSIVDQIKHQFPDFYNEQGPDFVAFLEAYYEWMEQETGIEYTRKLFEIRDIDDTFVKFLNNFRYKYMHDLPQSLLGNQRLLQKHILELYRSKGSDAGLKLLFRLLFNEDVGKYIPSYDIFKTSDNTWVEPHYIEISDSPLLNQYNGQAIYGAVTGASAIVESVEHKYIDGNVIHLLFVSNIKGNFSVGEKVLLENPDIINSPVIKGSVTKVELFASSSGYEVGDLLTSTVRQKPVKMVVSSTYIGAGILEFTLVNGGSYYSMNADFILSTGGNTTGAGASVRVGSLANTFLYSYNTDKILPYKDIALNDVYPFPTYPTANLSTVIGLCLDRVSVTVGTIKTLLVLNPGKNYDDYVNIEVIDPYTSTSGITNEDGVQVGTDANVTSKAIYGDGLIETAHIISSGYNFQEEDIVLFTNEDNSKTASVKMLFDGVGYDEGHFDNSKSFLSDDKYLFDGHYYQDYSYVVRAARNLNKYIDILRDLYHPAGNAVYGDITEFVGNQITNDIVLCRIVTTPN